MKETCDSTERHELCEKTLAAREKPRKKYRSLGSTLEGYGYNSTPKLSKYSLTCMRYEMGSSSAAMSLGIFTLDYPPWVTVKNINGSKEYGGALVDIIAFAAKSAKIQYSFLETQNLSLGKTVSWLDLTKSLHKNESDMILLPYLITEERLLKFSFTAETYFVSVDILSGRPKTLGIDSLSQIFPVSPKVFLFLIIFWCVISLITKYSEHLYSFIKTEPQNDSKSVSSFEYAWDYFTASFSQSMRLELKSPGSKLLATLWWFSIFFFSTTISNTMKASYTVSEEVRVDNIRDVVNTAGLRTLIRRGTAYEDYFQNSAEVLKRQIWVRAKETGGLINTNAIDDNVASIVEGNSVLITGYDDVPKFVSKFCNKTLEGAFYLSSRPVYWQPVGMPIRKGLDRHFKEIMDEKIRMFISTEQIGSYFKKLEWKSNPCRWRSSSFEGEMKESFSLVDFKPAARLWTLCSLISFGFFLLETLKFYVHKFYGDNQSLPVSNNTTIEHLSLKTGLLNEKLSINTLVISCTDPKNIEICPD